MPPPTTTTRSLIDPAPQSPAPNVTRRGVPAAAGREQDAKTGRLSRGAPSRASAAEALAARRLGDVLGGRALLPLHDVELHDLTLGERLEAVAGDGAVVDEAVLLTVVGRDEAEALRVVEPLHFAGRTHSQLLMM